MYQDAITYTPSLTSDITLEKQDTRALIDIGNAEPVIKIFIFAVIIGCINMVAFL